MAEINISAKSPQPSEIVFESSLLVLISAVHVNTVGGARDNHLEEYEVFTPL